MISTHLGSFYTSTAFVAGSNNEETASAELLTNSDGDRLVRSLLVYTDAGDVLVGASAERASLNPANRLVSLVFKSFINDSGNSDLNSSLIDMFRTVKSTVDDVGQSTGGIEGLALTVPVDSISSIADIQGKLRKLAVESGLINGKAHFMLVPEPIAYINAVPNSKDLHNSNVMIVDCGSVHLTCSLLAMRSGVPVLVDFETTDLVSGNAFTEALVDYCLQEFHQKTRFPVQDLKSSKKVLHKLRRYAEDAKQNLSNSQNAMISVESLYEGCDYQSNINRMRFENLNQCQQLFNKFKTFLQSFLQKHAGRIDKIMIVGGASMMPKFFDTASNTAKHLGIEVISFRNTVLEWPALGAISELTQRLQVPSIGDQSDAKLSKYSLSLLTVDIDGNKNVESIVKPYQPLPYAHTVELQPMLGKSGGYAGIVDDFTGKLIKMFQIDEYDTDTMSLWLQVKLDDDDLHFEVNVQV